MRPQGLARRRGSERKLSPVALSTADRYRIEEEAAEKGSFRAMLLDLAGDVGRVERDVQTILWVLLPLASTALVLAAAAFIVAVIK